MTEKELTDADKKRIKDEISLTFIFGLLFIAALILLLSIGIGVVYLFGVKVANGFGRRLLFIIGGLSLPILAISWTNVLKFIDIKRSKKLSIRTLDYEIEKQKEGFVLKTKEKPRLKLNIYDPIVPMLIPTAPINIEVSKITKTLLFISNDNENLIERVDNEENVDK